jgi:hypothetical protein
MTRAIPTSAILALIPLLLVLCLSAQQPSAISPDSFTTADCVHRAVPITVLSAPAGTQLQVTDLQVRAGNESPAVLFVEREQLAPRIEILLDTSGSMQSNFGPKWKHALIAAEFALEAIPTNSLVALVTFDTQTHATNFASREDAQKRLLALKDKQPIGRTAIYNAVQDSLSLFGDPKFGDAIYIVSDGRDDYGKQDRKRVTEALLRRGIRVFAFVVQDPRSPMTPEEFNGPAELYEFVKSTGGSYQSPQITQEWIASKQRLDSIQLLRSQLQSPYRLEIQLAARLSRSVKLQIKPTMKEVELSYPQHIEPCSAVSAAARP